MQIGALKYFKLNKKQVPVTYFKPEVSRECIKTLSLFSLGRSEVILSIKKKSTKMVTITRLQFSLIQSYICRVPKVHGISISNPIAILDLYGQKTFQPRQICVVFSWLKKLPGMHLKRSVLIKTNTPAKDEHEWLGLHHPFPWIAKNFLKKVRQ